MNFEETIIAPATGNQPSAIAVLRISGEKAFPITQKIFQPKGKKNVLESRSHQLIFGNIMNNDEIVDEVLVSIFKNPHSYTGEDTIEISCHGSSFIQNQILQLYLNHGARMAEPGEFTMRAFKNGKLDLSQAEAVADLIASDSKASHDIAMKQMRGGISSKMKDLREELIRFTALIELELDFTEEDVEFADRTKLLNLLQNVQAQISELIQSFDYGNALKNGVPVAIVGKPNAGKSTLLNTLLSEERAIVSPIAGTTRDTIEEVIHIDGIAFRLIDTAGIRDTTDEIEEIGVQRAKEKIKSAKILLYLFNSEEDTPQEVIDFVQSVHHQDLHIILLHNKSDITSNEKSQVFFEEIKTHLVPDYSTLILGISAKEQTNIPILKMELSDYVKSLKPEESVVITNARHLHALQQAQLALTQTKEAMEMGIPSDLFSQDLREAIKHLGSITGDIDVDRDILGTIFGSFCIGK
ncbi:tRNA uridine-5-carboxymethylaminomethyl(34) synthesis GTPase MnmE [Weeksellaceae bacterium TAE3-ERU29]|nr:tRNA uridine-5-carboxymethylaminomethyl(34) synthesis GTPase MnmE [Weeksellaceae bacterium TAE3-ERU29]